MKKMAPNIKVKDKITLTTHKEISTAVRDKVLRSKAAFKTKGY
jgi:hypothetical protein